MSPLPFTGTRAALRLGCVLLAVEMAGIGRGALFRLIMVVATGSSDAATVWSEQPGSGLHCEARGGAGVWPVLEQIRARRDALAALDRALSGGRPFVAGDRYTVADIALYAYVHCAGDAGAYADPLRFAHVTAWLERVEAQPGFVNDLTPIPPHASERTV